MTHPDSTPTQTMIFTNKVLPSLFHGEAGRFLKFLGRDGNKFLRFYWGEAAKKLPEAQHQDSFGLQYDIRQKLKQTTIILIQLPQPQQPGEAHFAALIYRPYRGTHIFGIPDTTRLVLLEHHPTEYDQQATRLVEIDRKLHREVLGPGTPPRLEVFFNACWDMVKAESQ
jgi:hypothetical protein